MLNFFNFLLVIDSARGEGRTLKPLRKIPHKNRCFWPKNTNFSPLRAIYLVFDGLPKIWAKNVEGGSEKVENKSTFWKGGTITFFRDTRVSGKRGKGYTLPIIFCVHPQISTSR